MFPKSCITSPQKKSSATSHSCSLAQLFSRSQIVWIILWLPVICFLFFIFPTIDQERQSIVKHLWCCVLICADLHCEAGQAMEFMKNSVAESSARNKTSWRSHRPDCTQSYGCGPSRMSALTCPLFLCYLVVRYGPSCTFANRIGYMKWR